MRISIEEDNLETVQINNLGTRDSLDVSNIKSSDEYISNDIIIEYIDDVMIIMNAPTNSRHKIRVFFKKKEITRIKQKLEIK